MSGGGAGALADEAVIRVVVEGAVRRLVIDNATQRNALRPAMSQALTAALREAGDDDACRAIVLHGEGDAFCSGGDVRQIAEQQALAPARQTERLTAINELVRAIRRCPRPVIAAVEGDAAGAGASLAFACDLVVASRSARFAVAHVRLGISPDGGATLALPRAVPMQLANEWLMQGEAIGAERLHGVGLVNRIVAPGEAVNEALRWARSLATGSAEALASIKMLVGDACWPELDRHLERERTEFVRTMFGAGALERVQAFLRRRS
ncbi:MAG: enoyl-CoA hydratase family protein [Pseudomonadota bacterium]|nr:enoyl-CoA hydratase family protein [Pseudomonadota bacterium]